MPRARSRLKRAQKNQPKKRLWSKLTDNFKQSQDGRSIRLTSYLKHLPALILAIIFGYISSLILIKIEPDSIKHFLIPNSYLPLMISLFLSSFFLLSFLSLSSTLGLILASSISIAIFLHLNQVVWTSGLVLTLLAITLLLVISSLLLQRASGRK